MADKTENPGNSDSAEIAIPDNVPALFDDAMLAEVTDLNSALAALEAGGIATESISDYGNGFVLLPNKDQLVGKPFLIIQWRFNDGDYAQKFVSAAVVTENGDKFILNDGGSGICAQLVRVTKTRLAKGQKQTAQSALICRNGLTRSDYTYVNDKGEKTPAVTYYLAE